MFHLLLAASVTSPPAAGTGEVATIFAILAAAVVVVGGLVALVRAIWKVATILRDNTIATKGLTDRMDQLVSSVDGRFDSLLHRVEQLESKEKVTP